MRTRLTRYVMCIGSIVPLWAIAPPAAAEGLSFHFQMRYVNLDARPLHSLTNAQLAEFMSLRKAALQGKADAPTAADDVAFYARKAIDQPYRLNSQIFDLSSGDCVCLVERSIALACAEDWATYYKLVKRLRYKDGVVTFLETNFFTLADWVPNNQFLLRDITQELGPAQKFTEEVYRRAFLQQLDFGQGVAGVGSGIGRAKADALAAKIASVPDKESLEVHYVANEQLSEALPKLRSGDIALVIRTFPATKTRPEHLSCDHMGVIALNGGEVNIVHSSRPKAREMGLMVFVRAYPFVRGFVFLRLRDDAGQIGPTEAAKVEPESRPDPTRVDARNTIVKEQINTLSTGQ